MRFVCNVCGLFVSDCMMMYGLLLCVFVCCACLKHVRVLFAMHCDVGRFVAVCGCVCVCDVLFNVRALFVNMLSGVVWFVCLYYCLCLCAMLLFNLCAFCVWCIV